MMTIADESGGVNLIEEKGEGVTRSSEDDCGRVKRCEKE